MTDFERLMSKRAPERRLVVPIDVTEAEEAELDAATAYLTRLQGAGEGTPAADLEAAEARVEAATGAIDAKSMMLVLRACGATTWELLVERHPPQEADHTLLRQQSGIDDVTARWHAETFNPALVAASLVSPKLTIAEVKKLFATWSQGEVQLLIQTAVQVNVGSRIDLATL